MYACVVHDENDRYYTIIDDNGCSLDEEIIPTPEYDVEQGLIYTPSKAFRWVGSGWKRLEMLENLWKSGKIKVLGGGLEIQLGGLEIQNSAILIFCRFFSFFTEFSVPESNFSSKNLQNPI